MISSTPYGIMIGLPYEASYTLRKMEDASSKVEVLFEGVLSFPRFSFRWNTVLHAVHAYAFLPSARKKGTSLPSLHIPHFG
jgi:hypothetical protein